MTYGQVFTRIANPRVTHPDLSLARKTFHQNQSFRLHAPFVTSRNDQTICNVSMRSPVSRVSRTWKLVCLCACAGHFGVSTSLAQTTSSPPSLLGELQQAFSGVVAVHSVTMHGQVLSYSGKGSDSGTIDLHADNTGATEVDLHLPAGTVKDTASGLAVGRKCQWTGTDGKLHTTSRTPNCLAALPWFMPQIALQASSPVLISLQDLGNVTVDAQSYRVLRHQLTFPASAAPNGTAALIAQLTQADLRLNPKTLLPSQLSYTLYSESNTRLTLQGRAEYSDFRNILGVQIPFHIKRYLNGALILDITISEATVL